MRLTLTPGPPAAVSRRAAPCSDRRAQIAVLRSPCSDRRAPIGRSDRVADVDARLGEAELADLQPAHRRVHAQAAGALTGIALSHERFQLPADEEALDHH